MTNGQIADAFDQVADILEFQGANPFRVRAYRNAARTIGDSTESVAAIAADGTRKLTDIEGIGADLAEKIATLVSSGSLPMLEELKQQVPASVLAIMRIPGLGPKKAAALHKELGIATLDELKAACEQGKVRALKGFGAKTEQTILAGMAIAAEGQKRFTWASADEIAQRIIAHMRGEKSIRQIEAAGSYRRGKDSVGDLDILVDAPDAKPVMDRFGQIEGLTETLARGETKMAIRVTPGIQVDLRVVPSESFGAALQYFTGSKDHNVIVRGIAKDRGLKINEYGVYRVHDGQETYIAGATEADVYATLDMPVFPPELREARQEFDWAAKNELPDLIELEDLVGDLHMHTNETDGSATLEEMVEAAQARGLKYIAITDHSQRVSMARGLNPERLLRQWEQIDKLNATLGKSFRVLKGIECDILESGEMDLPDDVLAQGDWIIASVHYGQNQPRAQITARIIGAIENPNVCAIAHPTGRLINKREPYQVDLDAVMAAAVKHGKLLELNANPMRLDLNDVFCAAAKRHGIPIVINSDAHHPAGLGVLRYGILQARRAGLTKADVANTRTLSGLGKLLKRKW